MSNNIETSTIALPLVTPDWEISTTSTRPRRSSPKGFIQVSVALLAVINILCGIIIDFLYTIDVLNISLGQFLLSALLLGVALCTIYARGWASLVINALILWYFLAIYIIPWLR